MFSKDFFLGEGQAQNSTFHVNSLHAKKSPLKYSCFLIKQGCAADIYIHRHFLCLVSISDEKVQRW